jgi:3-methyladenine DNA glycosylase AlkD
MSQENPAMSHKSAAQAPTPEQVAKTIAAKLRALGDPARAKGAQQYFKHEIVCVGVDAPTLRRLVKEQAVALKRVWVVDQALACCDRLVREPELEVRGAGTLLLGAFRNDFTLAIVPHARRWLGTRLDNWALVDGFCMEVLTPLLNVQPAFERTLKAWSEDSCLWVRRAAVVTLVPDARHGQRLDLAYRLAREHFPDAEDLMHKAVGWLLREAGKTDMERLRAFLIQHGPAIPRTSLRYAIERFPVLERSKILEQTRPVGSSPKKRARG